LKTSIESVKQKCKQKYRQIFIEKVDKNLTKQGYGIRLFFILVLNKVNARYGGSLLKSQ
jgi:hypothetical protein